MFPPVKYHNWNMLNISVNNIDIDLGSDLQESHTKPRGNGDRHAQPKGEKKHPKQQNV
jgi:hypothetical protein